MVYIGALMVNTVDDDKTQVWRGYTVERGVSRWWYNPVDFRVLVKNEVRRGWWALGSTRDGRKKIENVRLVGLFSCGPVSIILFVLSFLWRFVSFLFSDSLTLSRGYGGRGEERTLTPSDGMRVRDRDSYLCL